MSEERPDKLVYVHNLGAQHYMRFLRLETLEDLDAAIESYTKVALLAPDEFSDRISCLLNLGMAHHVRFERLGRPEDLDAAIKHKTETVRLTPSQYIDKSTCLDSLGVSYYARFKQSGELKDLNAAIDLQSEAVHLKPDGHPSNPTLLSNLGIAYHSRFQRLGQIMDLNEAIACESGVVHLMPDTHPDKPARESSLGISYHTQFEQKSDPACLDAAILHKSKAVQLTPDEHPEKHSYLYNLGESYHARFESLGQIEDLDTAIKYLTEGLLLTPGEHLGRPGCLTTLGAAYLRRFERLGDLEDLDGAIKCCKESVQLTSDDNPLRSSRLDNLGISYHQRFQRFNVHADLDKAIECYSEAVSLLPDTHTAKHAPIHNLSTAHITRFQLSEKTEDIDAAIRLTSEVARLISDRHAHRPLLLTNLGEFYHIRFKHFRDLHDVNAAIEYFALALSLRTEDDPEKPMCLYGLGLAHVNRAHHLGQYPNASLAIKSGGNSQLQPTDGPLDVFPVPSNLRTLSLPQGESKVNEADFAIALQYFGRAVISRTSPATMMIIAVGVARLLHWYRLSDCLEGYGRAVGLLSQVAWLGSTVHRRYQGVAEMLMAPMEAAAAAIEVSQYSLALEWLEEGRSIVWNQMLQLRPPLDDLRAIDAELANKLEQIGSQLSQAGSSNQVQDIHPEALTLQEQTSREHHSLALIWEQHLEQVRKIPNFERFLLPRKFSEIAKCTCSSTVIIINIHSMRCDAIALRQGSSDLIHVALSSFSHTQCVDLRERLLTALRGGNVRARGGRRPIFENVGSEDVFRDILASLWFGVVKPILDALGFLALQELPIGTELPRVTWCATGPLTSLPLHAAGYYDQPLTRTFDYVVSSYTPTLGALMSSSTSPPEFQGILAVGQAAQPGYPLISGTIAELNIIHDKAGGLALTKLTEEVATPEAVLSAMKHNSWVHLACHASQNMLDPTASAFVLYGGQLDIKSITREHLPAAQLAFLSACETATGDETIPDEAVHLAASMLMSGYRTVVATMWSIEDADAPEVADHFYSRLLRNRVPNSGEAARSLHDAVEHLRARVGESSFWRWVPYIHVGL
ncbi:hypothetical protein FRC12_004920 [Ceratobasidium sp. 428]|nr:hypothetical protein FRC12_004920 [Ceratobasidium sp. 428]